MGQHGVAELRLELYDGDGKVVCGLHGALRGQSLSEVLDGVSRIFREEYIESGEAHVLLNTPAEQRSAWRQRLRTQDAA